MEEQRLDKWLWCARLFKTRRLAAEAVRSGRVGINGARAKPARSVHAGDAILLSRPPYEFSLTIIGVTKQRVPADQVGELYQEAEESRKRREELAQSIKASAIVEDRHGGKLSKKDRRERDKMKRSM